MANEYKIPNGLIVVGDTSGSTVLDIQGTEGQLFSITDDLSGDIFSVSDISGMPIINVNADGTITFSDLLDSSSLSVVVETDGVLAKNTLTLADLGYTGTTDANTYVHPTHPGDGFSVDTGSLTGATVVSDIDINVTTDTLGHVTDANATVATRNLTLANLGYTGTTDANTYVHPTYTARTESGDTGPLTGATVISDLDFNITTDTSGHVTACDITTLATRNLTLADLGYTGATNANYYSLPVASATLGGVKSGTDITVDGSGNVSVNDDSHNHVISNVDGLQTALDAKATPDDISTAISNLVDSSPTTLDTLNELAAALGDDPNFATTVATSIGTKLAKTSNLSDLDNVATARTNLGVDVAGTINYTHPTHPGDDAAVDTGALTGATVISDLDFNVTTDTLGHVTDANATVATRTLTLANLGYTGTTDANTYVHPTYTARTESGDTGTLTGATVISDLDFNITTDTSGHVTACDITTLATRNLTLADLGYTGATNANYFTYSHPTHPGDDAAVDTGALTGATVISDLDFNVTTDTEGHVTDANATVSTRNLTLANLGYTGDTNAQANVATNISWTAGTTSGPICNSSTGTDSAIPVASASASGVVNTTTQTFTGAKTFLNTVNVSTTLGGDGGWVNGLFIKNTGVAGESALSFANSVTAANYWITGLNQTDIYRIAYGTSFVDGNTKLTLTTAGALSVPSTIQGTNISASGDVIGNSATATKLATARTIDITGDITATAVSFDGSSNIAISASVNDDSHNHVISNVDGLQAALDAKATPANISTAISNLVDSSPATMDTLNELAAALGDDPNFATTVATSIGTKLAKTSNLSDLDDVATARTNLGVDVAGTVNYNHPTHPGDDFSVDTGALTGAVVVSDIDINVTTDTLGHVTDANGTVSTRTLTLADLGYTGATNANYYTHPTYTAFTKSGDTGPLTGATVISDLDFNITTDTSGHVTACDITTISTRNLTLADLGYTGDTNAQANVATNISWTAGTTAGPICNSSTGSDSAIPVASATASGVVNTTTQTFAGAKTFNSNVSVNGLLTATTKSFTINHPTKPDMKLRYGSLEGPEYGVYVRGKLTNSNIIQLPDYWVNLVHEDSITVQLTPIGKPQNLFIKEIKNNTIIIENSYLLNDNTNCFYIVYGERKDVDHLITEI